MKKTLIALMVTLLVGSTVWAEDDVQATSTTKDQLKRPLTAFPKGYQLKKGSKSNLSVVEVDGKKALQFKSEEQAYIYMRSGFSTFKPKAKYVMTCDIKITDMKGKSKKKSGVMLQVKSSTGKPYSWVKIIHNGSTEGWVTATITFDTGEKPKYCKSRIYLFLMDISGTVLFRNLTIKATTEDVERGFQIEDDFVDKAILKL